MKIQKAKVLFITAVAALMFAAGCQSKTGVVISKAERSPEIAGKPKVRIVNITRKGSGIEVELDVDNFALGIQTRTPRAAEIANSSKGQHVHLIIDNKPYYAIYKQGKSNLVHIKDIAEGKHTLAAFPSRSYHESVKTPGAISVADFKLTGGKVEFQTVEKTKPLIMYSRPKGTYEGDAAKKIMLDFYLNNLELSADGNKARYKIRKKGESREYIYETDEWTPAFVSGLSTGTYSISFKVLDKNGNLVRADWNDTEREIEVK